MSNEKAVHNCDHSKTYCEEHYMKKGCNLRNIRLQTSAKHTDEEIKEWRRIIGEPQFTIQIEEYTYGFWQITSGVCVIRIDKQGPNPATQQIFNHEYIDKLVETQQTDQYFEGIMKR